MSSPHSEGPSRAPVLPEADVSEKHSEARGGPAGPALSHLRIGVY